MGHEIEKIALERNHTIVATPDNEKQWAEISLSPDFVDVVIDFSTPDSAAQVVYNCLKSGVAVVSGTTGWMNGITNAEKLCHTSGGTFFYAPNFSIGVNLFFEINRKVARMLSGQDYKARMNEIHHIHKLDAPSGTAIALANDIISENPNYSSWIAGSSSDENILPISSERTGEVPGTHSIEWFSDADTIEIKHTAHNRKGFALGAVLAAEWVYGKTGFFGMTDLLNSNS